MAKFITGEELEKAVCDIIWDAKQTLLIVSPFIKLDDYFKNIFDKHANNPKLHLIIVFGKNEDQISRSLSKLDFDYFKKFLNISIIYVPNLHAKYYGNDEKGVITSINLYDYSFKHNIEFGIYTEASFLDKFRPSNDQDAWDLCMQIAKSNEAVFVKRPVYEKKMLSTLLGKNYIKSDILHDITDTFYSENNNYSLSKLFKAFVDFPEELEIGSHTSIRPTREEVENVAPGFCIRTGRKITFNPKRPFSENAYRNWAQFGNVDYPEKYCHRTGRLSNGKTSMRSPIM